MSPRTRRNTKGSNLLFSYIALVGGILLGAFMFRARSVQEQSALVLELGYPYVLEMVRRPLWYALPESLLRNSGPVLLVWILGFSRPAAILGFGVLFVQGMGVGFASAMALGQALDVMFLYLPQAAVVVPALASVQARSIDHALGRWKQPLHMYVVALPTPLLLTLCATAFDILLVPVVVGLFA